MTPITRLASILLLVPLAACGESAVNAYDPATPEATATVAPAEAEAMPPGEYAATATQPGTDAPMTREPDVVYVPTPTEVVEAMLKLAKVGPDDVLYDLGSGDGRIPIAASKQFGIRAVGIDINPERIREANANAQAAGVTGKVTFLQQDLFESDISDASVVTLYLLQSLNVKLRPKLLADLKPGTRIVSHAFDMAGEWEPEQTVEVGDTRIYLWTVPEKG